MQKAWQGASGQDLYNQIRRRQELGGGGGGRGGAKGRGVGCCMMGRRMRMETFTWGT